MDTIPDDSSIPMKRKTRLLHLKFTTNNMLVLIRLSRRGNNGTYQGFQSNHFKVILHKTLILDENDITNLE